MVPASDFPGNISLKNAVKFLQNGNYVAHKDVNQTSEEKYESKKLFTRKIGGETITFEVYDSVHGFTKKEWRRVVCLFSCGETFQLKDWPPKDDNTSDPLTDQERHLKIVNLFHRVKGFYLHFQDI